VPQFDGALARVVGSCPRPVDSPTSVKSRLAELGLVLPKRFSAPPDLELPFDTALVSGDHVYISGHGPIDGSEILMRGKVGSDVTVEQAYEAARLTGLSILATLDHVLGDLDRVTRWVKVLGFVNCATGFNVTPAVINGFSDLILDLWGDAGRHARSAIGAAELPFDIPVEIEAIAEVS
jgi:enamine deaminase RidA (YjgF/YER057c/UK114 family)